MKTKLLHVLCLYFVFLNTKAQEIKNQTEEFATIKKGNYTAYLTDRDDGSYKGGVDDMVFKITETKTSRVKPNSIHKEIYFITRGNPDKPEKLWESKKMFLPDNEAFPVTYVAVHYEGNKKLQKQIGYVKRKIDKHNTRIVFLNSNIYILEDYKNKDDYRLTTFLEYQPKELGYFRKMKLSMRSTKKMETLQPHKLLQEYLNAATIKQKKVYSQWIKQPANKTFIANQKAKKILMDKVIKKMSDDWLKSDEYKRIRRNNQLASEARSRSIVTVVNNTGSTINIKESTSGGSTTLSPGASTSCNCNADIFYKYDNGGHVKNSDIKTKFYSAGTGCGKTVNVK